MTLNIILKIANCRIVTLPAIPLAVTLPPALLEPIFNYHNVTLYSEVNFRNNPFLSTIVCREGLKN